MFSILVVLAGFVLVSGLSRRLEGSWIAPSAVWPVAWGLYAAAAIPYMALPLEFVPGLLWILLNCVSFLIGSLLSRSIWSTRERWNGGQAEWFPILGALVAAFSIAGLLALILAVRSLGFSVLDLFSFHEIAKISALSRTIFNFGDAEQGSLARGLVVLSYTGPLFGGLAFAVATHWRQRVLGLVPLIEIVLVGIVYGSRMGVLFGGSFWLAAFVAGNLLDTDDKPRARARLFFIVGGLSFGLLAGLSTLIQFIRYFVGSQKTASLILADPFGFLAAFTSWFRESGHAEDGLAGGFYHFERIGRMLGFNRPAFPAIDVGFTSSNVYTVFRALIQDFGSFGSLIVVLVTGIVASLAYRAVLTGRSTWVGPLALVYAYLFSGMAVSLFTYAGPTLGAAVFVLYTLTVGRPMSIARNMLSVIGRASEAPSERE